MFDVVSAPPTLTAFPQALPSSHEQFPECLVYSPGFPAMKGHTLQPL